MVGKSVLFLQPDDDRTYLFSNFTHRLRPDRNLIDAAYLAWFLRSPQALGWRYETQQTTVGLRNLQTAEFLSQCLPTPPLPIQRAVAAYLDALQAGREAEPPMELAEQRRIVARIEELAAQIHEARTLRQEAAEEAEALYPQQLSKAMTPHGEGWKRETIADVIESMDAGWSPQCDDIPASEDEWGVLKTTSVQWCDFQPQHNKVLPPTLRPIPELAVKKGDVLVTRAGPRKRVAVVAAVRRDEPRLTISDKLIRLRTNRANIEPRFLELSLASPFSQEHLVQRKTGLADAQVNISQSILKATPVAYPPLAEQRRIVAELDALQAEVGALKRLQAQTASELDALLPAILDRAFKGEL